MYSGDLYVTKRKMYCMYAVLLVLIPFTIRFIMLQYFFSKQFKLILHVEYFSKFVFIYMLLYCLTQSYLLTKFLGPQENQKRRDIRSQIGLQQLFSSVQTNCCSNSKHICILSLCTKIHIEKQDEMFNRKGSNLGQVMEKSGPLETAVMAQYLQR